MKGDRIFLISGICLLIYTVLAALLSALIFIATSHAFKNHAMADEKTEIFSKIMNLPCPTSVEAITKDNVIKMVMCPDLQKEYCQQACGQRYDKVEVANIARNKGYPGILCQDFSTNKMKNGVDISKDENRKNCIEKTDPKGYNICLHDNKIIHGVELGAFAQCQSKVVE